MRALTSYDDGAWSPMEDYLDDDSDDKMGEASPPVGSHEQSVLLAQPLRPRWSPRKRCGCHPAEAARQERVRLARAMHSRPDCKENGGIDAVDTGCGFLGDVEPRDDHFIHVAWLHPHLDRSRHRGGCHSRDSGPTTDRMKTSTGGSNPLISNGGIPMNASTAASSARRLSRWSVAISILMMIAGILAIGLPVLAGIAVYSVVAWMLALCGMGHFLFAWNSRSIGGALWQVLLGVLYVGVGIFLLMHPVAGLATLTLVLAIYLFMEGVLELILSSQMRGMVGRGWFIFDGIVTLILGVLIWRTWPSSTDWVIGTLIGISMLSSGLTRLILSLAAREQSERPLPDQSTRDRSTGAPSAITP
jgi:uncharacterized membrane protein HdeD (DUF308 family)